MISPWTRAGEFKFIDQPLSFMAQDKHFIVENSIQLSNSKPFMLKESVFLASRMRSTTREAVLFQTMASCFHPLRMPTIVKAHKKRPLISHP